MEPYRSYDRERYKSARSRAVVSKGNYTEDGFHKGGNLDNEADNIAPYHPLSPSPCLVAGEGMFDAVDVDAFVSGLRNFWLVDLSEHERYCLRDVCLSPICHFGYRG